MTGRRVSFRVAISAGVSPLQPMASHNIHRPYGMDGWILNWTERGRAVVNDGEEQFCTSQGDFLLFPPDVPHIYGCAPGEKLWEHLWVYFFPRPEWRAWLTWPEKAGGVLALRVEESELQTRLVNRFRELIAYVQGSRRRREALAMNALEEMLLWFDDVNPQAENLRDERIEAVLEVMATHLDESLSVAELAEVAHLSPGRFAHLFREEMKCSPMQMLERLRVRRACEQLAFTQLPISQISRACGFAGADYFARVFRRHTSCSPRDYRNQARAGGDD